MVFLFGQGGWIWWHGALALIFVMLLGVAIYAWRDPKGPGGGPFLMFMAFCLAWFLMLVSELPGETAARTDSFQRALRRALRRELMDAFCSSHMNHGI